MGRKSLKRDDPNARLTKAHQKLVLQWIAEFRTTAWIVAELKARYGITRHPGSIDQHYRYPEKHQATIAKYREEWSNRYSNEAFAHKSFVLQALKEAYDLAREQKDVKAIVSVIKQACDVMGHNAPPELEINHNHSHYGSFEDVLGELLKQEDSQTVDVTAEPSQPLALPDSNPSKPLPALLDLPAELLATDESE